jgi:putative hemolysin
LDTVSGEALTIVILVVLSALYSGMETALLSLSEVRLRARVEDGESLPRMLQAWLDKPNLVLATLLVGNNLVNITASALATDLTRQLVEPTPYANMGIPIAVGAMTLLILIFGEVAPKTFAKHHPERYLVSLPLLTFSYSFFMPFTRLLVFLTQRVVETMGGEFESEKSLVTEEHIEEMVRVGSAEGSIDREATELLTGVLELDDKVAREIMVPRTDLEAISQDASLTDVFATIDASGFSRYPVYRDSIDNVVGVLYLKDLLKVVLGEGRDVIRLAEVMRPPMIYPENIPVQDLLVAMKRERVHLAIVASEYGGVAGIVTLEDIVEEVFGDIYDEHDTEQAPIRALSDDTWLVEGVVTISDLEDEIGKDLEDDEDYETVAGLLMKAAGCVPRKGFIHETQGYSFEVLKTDATHILEIAVRAIPDLATDTATPTSEPEENAAA